MADEFIANVEDSSKRFGWHLLGNTVGFFRDLIFWVGDVASRSGDLIIRAGELAGANGKEMYKLALKIRERRDNDNPFGNDGAAGGQQRVSRAENVWLALTAIFIGWSWRYKDRPINAYSEKGTVYIPGLLVLGFRGVEWAIKTVGFVAWGLGETVKMLGRFFGYGRDKINLNAPYTANEEYLRAAEHKFILVLKDTFSNIVPNKDEEFRRIYTLIAASALRQVGLLLSLPGRVVQFAGQALSGVNMIINNALAMVSRWGEKTFLEYARNLHDASGSMDAWSPSKIGTLTLAAVVGLIGAVVTYVPKFVSFLNNIYPGIPGFLLETAGRVLKWPGMFVYGLGQRIASDPHQHKFTLDADFNTDDPHAAVDPDQTIGVKDKLYRTYVRNAASQQRALTEGIAEIRARYKLLRTKGGEASAQAAAEHALEGGYGVIAKELMGHHYGHGQLHGMHPTENDPIFDAIKTANQHNPNAFKDSDNANLGFRKPDLTQSWSSYWTKRSAIARYLSRTVEALDTYDKKALNLPDRDGAELGIFNQQANNYDGPLNFGYDKLDAEGERTGLLSRARGFTSY